MEEEKIIQSHNEDTQRLINRVDAQRYRMEADLQERIRERKKAKLKIKQTQLQKEMLDNCAEMEVKEQKELVKIAENERAKLETLQKSVDEKLNVEVPVVPSDADHPLTEQQLSAILLSTPMYQKIEQIKLILQTQSTLVSTSSHQQQYTDSKDTDWITDTVFHPMDINNISTRAFVVYKFGCNIINSLVTHCNHSPVSLLLADKIPPSKRKYNAFPNSYTYDFDNKILYMRSERLDNIGEFVLVLIHALSHIKANSSFADYDPTFLKEFYHSLSACYSDLFLSRYCSSMNNTAVSIDTSSHKVPVNTFDYNSSVIDDLLENRVLLSVDMEGCEFSHKRIMERLQNYAMFRVESKLRKYLDAMEEVVENDEHHHHTEASVKVATHSLSKFATKKRWQAAAEKAVGETSTRKQTERYLKIQINNIRERIDMLNNEYIQVTKAKLSATEDLTSLKDELIAQQSDLKSLEEGTDKFQSKKDAIKNLTLKISAAQNDLAVLDLRSKSCIKRLEVFKLQLDEKLQTLTIFSLGSQL